MQTIALSLSRRIARSLNDASHVFGLAALHAPVGRVQNFLIVPAFFAWNRKVRLAFDCGSEGIHLSCVGELVRDCVGLHDGSASAQLNMDRVLHVQSVVSTQDTGFTNQFEGRAVFSTE